MSTNPRVTIALPAGCTKDARPWDWRVTNTRGRLFVTFGDVVTLIFDDPQEGIDVLTTFAAAAVEFPDAVS